MLLNELKKEITALGFGAQIENADLLISSINRALRDIYLRRSILTTVRLFAVGLTPKTFIKEIRCTNGKTVTLPFTGRAYSMRVCGNGFYRVDGWNGSSKITSFETGSESLLVRGFINDQGKISFYGGMSFAVYDFSLYDEIYTPNATDLPDGAPTLVFDIRKMYGDFLSFIGPAKDADGREIKNCKMRDGKLELPSEFRGEVELTYRRLPKPVLNSESHLIDIPDEYSHALALLSSFYIFLHSDEKKASRYLEQYEKAMTLIEKESYQELDNRYLDVNGWA